MDALPDFAFPARGALDIRLALCRGASSSPHAVHELGRRARRFLRLPRLYDNRPSRLDNPRRLHRARRALHAGRNRRERREHGHFLRGGDCSARWVLGSRSRVRPAHAVRSGSVHGNRHRHHRHRILGHRLLRAKARFNDQAETRGVSSPKGGEGRGARRCSRHSLRSRHAGVALEQKQCRKRQLICSDAGFRRAIDAARVGEAVAEHRACDRR